MVSYGLRFLVPSLSTLENMTPLVTLLNTPDPCGSAAKHFILGCIFCKYVATPARVPPVPVAHTKASNFFSLSIICSYISFPVPL